MDMREAHLTTKLRRIVTLVTIPVLPRRNSALVATRATHGRTWVRHGRTSAKRNTTAHGPSRRFGKAERGTGIRTAAVGLGGTLARRDRGGRGA